MTGPPRPKWTAENLRLLKDYLAEGRSWEWLAERFETTVAAVKMAASREGFTAHGRGTGKARKPAGLLGRIASLLGLQAPPEAPGEPIPDATLRAWAEDPEAFFRWLGVELFPYQREALGIIQGHDRVALVWGRQSGKDLLTGLYGLWAAIVRPGAFIVCVSPSQRQSDLWMERLRAFALRRKELRDEVADYSASELTFSNMSKVYSLPSGAQGSATIRGFARVSVLVVNEAAWVGEETFQAIQPFLAVSGQGAKLILASTPFGQGGYLWRAWNSDLFGKSHVPSSANPLIPKDFLAKERATMDSLSYASEYEAAFLSSQSAYFPTDLIQRCTQAYPLVESPLPEFKGMTFDLGADWARVAGADRTVLTIMGIDNEGSGKVLWIRSFDGVAYTEQANYVKWLHGAWRFRTVYSDASAHAVNDLLKSKGVPVEPIQFTVPGEVELFGRLKAAMEAGRLTIPNHPELIRELSTFEYKISERGHLLLHHVEGGHDDYPDSLALAALGLTTQRVALGVVDPAAFNRLEESWQSGPARNPGMDFFFSSRDRGDPLGRPSMLKGPSKRCVVCGQGEATGVTWSGGESADGARYVCSRPHRRGGA